MLNYTHPIIFLDVDGVLTSEEHLRRVASRHLDYEKNRLDPMTVDRLQRLVDVTDAHVVLSSTWRKYNGDVFCLMQFFSDYNIPVAGMTPSSAKGWREDEIKEWMRTHYFSHDCFVVLDDSVTDLTTMGDHLVRVPGNQGLQTEHVDRAIEVLKSYKSTLEKSKKMTVFERLYEVKKRYQSDPK